jgi:ABC-2 type transport system permease protein
MTWIAVTTAALRQTRRDRLMVALTLAFGPFFVAVYWLAFAVPTTSYQVAVLDLDRAVSVQGRTLDAAAGIEAALTAGQPQPGGSAATSPLHVVQVASADAGLALVRDGNASMLLELPPDLSASVARGGPATVVVHGDVMSPGYLVAGVLAQARAEAYLRLVTGAHPALNIAEEPLAGTASRTAFEQSVGGLLVFSVELLVFLTATTVARETEHGVMRRMRMSPMPAWSYMAGTSAVLLAVAVASAAATFATAYAFGFRSRGPVPVALLVVVVTALSVIGVGMAVGAACRTTAQAFVVANFPLGLLVFLSGTLFPVPHPKLVTVAGHGLGPLDLLPPAHAAAALTKVMTYGQGLGDVGFELTAVVVLSAVYFALGAAVLRRCRLRPAHHPVRGRARTGHRSTIMDDVSGS